MVEKLVIDLQNICRNAVKVTAALLAVLLLCGALAGANVSHRALAPQRPAAIGGLVCHWASMPLNAVRITLRHEERRRHVWLARFASLELRFEWESGPDRETWSATLQDRHGKPVAQAVATAETADCI